MLLQRASQTIILFDPQINLGAREAMHHLPSFSQEKTDSERWRKLSVSVVPQFPEPRPPSWNGRLWALKQEFTNHPWTETASSVKYQDLRSCFSVFPLFFFFFFVMQLNCFSRKHSGQFLWMFCFLWSMGPAQVALRYKIYLQCWRLRSWRFDPRVGKIPWRREWQPIPIFLPGQSHGQRSPVPMVHRVEESVKGKVCTHRRGQLVQWPHPG